MTPISDLPSSPSSSRVSRRHENTEIYAVTPRRTPYSAGRNPAQNILRSQYRNKYELVEDGVSEVSLELSGVCKKFIK